MGPAGRVKAQPLLAGEDVADLRVLLKLELMRRETLKALWYRVLERESRKTLLETLFWCFSSMCLRVS